MKFTKAVSILAFVAVVGVSARGMGNTVSTGSGQKVDDYQYKACASIFGKLGMKEEFLLTLLSNNEELANFMKAYEVAISQPSGATVKTGAGGATNSPGYVRAGVSKANPENF